MPLRAHSCAQLRDCSRLRATHRSTLLCKSATTVVIEAEVWYASAMCFAFLLPFLAQAGWQGTRLLHHCYVLRLVMWCKLSFTAGDRFAQTHQSIPHCEVCCRMTHALGAMLKDSTRLMEQLAQSAAVHLTGALATLGAATTQTLQAAGERSTTGLAAVRAGATLTASAADKHLSAALSWCASASVANLRSSCCAGVFCASRDIKITSKRVACAYAAHCHRINENSVLAQLRDRAMG